jgi:hypothetical protein
MNFDTPQLFASVVSVTVAAGIAAVLVFTRVRSSRPWRLFAYGALCACAISAVGSWTNFGRFHTIFVDAPGVRAGEWNRAKTERHLPFHFHEFFHYYLGAKYFRELGYEQLYDCTALADQEIAAQDGVAPRIGGWVRDLDDVLVDKTYEAALAHCRDDGRPRFTAERWASFENDIRELRRLVPDGWWAGATYDAGFNPPPSWVLVDSAIANFVPIRSGQMPTFLVATSLDALLLIACFFACRRAFGLAAAATAAVFFGASFIAGYSWTGGAFLRFTWLTTIVFALCAMRFGRWALAGALFAASTCDRLFPMAFAVGAVLPVAWRALQSLDDRRRLARFGAGFGGTAVILIAGSLLLFGAHDWRIFFERMSRHSDVYYVMHIGLKKVLTWRPWVPHKDFHGHVGLQHFHDFNLKLRATWVSMRLVAVPIQIAAVAGAVCAGWRRRPHESALLFGAVGMFFFNLPANYYYVVLALVPAFLLRGAITAPTKARRDDDFTVFAAFVAFCIATLVMPRYSSDDITYNHTISVLMGVFLWFWISAWARLPRLPRRSSSHESPPVEPDDAQALAGPPTEAGPR